MISDEHRLMLYRRFVFCREREGVRYETRQPLGPKQLQLLSIDCVSVRLLVLYRLVYTVGNRSCLWSVFGTI